MLCVVLGALALVDSLGQSAYAVWARGGISSVWGWVGATFAGAVTALAASGNRLSQLVGGDGEKPRLRLPAAVVAGIAAALLIAVALVALAAAAHGIAWGGMAPAGDPGTLIRPTEPTRTYVIAESEDWRAIGWPLFLGAFLTFVFSRTYAFVNRSSHASFYADRLTRAYLGASNPNRQDNKDARGVTDVVAGDDVPMRSYAPHRRGGPLHIVNVTLNETVDGFSQLEQRDRKGLALAVGPAGVTVGRLYHALWEQGGAEESGDVPRALDPTGDAASPGRYHVFPARCRPEGLSLGMWTAISGAAVSTGLGSRTSLALSLLCGLFNIRLGYWWNSATDPSKRRGVVRRRISRRLAAWLERVLPVHSHLLDEFTASFSGPARPHWYLTDGGHFENTGCYELLRRRLRFIVVCDNGADDGYRFADVAGLVRRARSDFGAEVEFLGRTELDSALPRPLRRAVGTLEEVAGKPASDGTGRRRNGAYAALARVRYPGGAAGTLLLVKPGVTGAEPADVREYAAAHPAFPQQTTGDQSFDEAQWESYRMLGETVGTSLFSAVPGRRWTPRSLRPLP